MIGIVGGVGPYSGVDLLRKVFDNTLANNDQEHLDVTLLSLSSSIIDRTAYLIGKEKVNPGIAIANVILKLQNIGATIIGIPCITAHSKKIFDAIQLQLKNANSPIKVLNMIKETNLFIAANYPNSTKIGLLSTTGTYKSGIFSKSLQTEGYEMILPTLEMQENLIHPAIYHPIFGIKSVSAPIHSQARKNLLQGISYLKDQGAEVVILGCTEIPLAITETNINGLAIIDSTTALARALIINYNAKKLKSI